MVHLNTVVCGYAWQEPAAGWCVDRGETLLNEMR